MKNIQAARGQVLCPAQPDERYAFSPVGNWRNPSKPSFALTCLRVVVAPGSTDSAVMEAISVANADMPRQSAPMCDLRRCPASS